MWVNRRDKGGVKGGREGGGRKREVGCPRHPGEKNLRFRGLGGLRR